MRTHSLNSILIVLGIFLSIFILASLTNFSPPNKKDVRLSEDDRGTTTYEATATGMTLISSLQSSASSSGDSQINQL
ncbi:MAG: hypothetical protein QW727_00785 [Candidatus Pacearchaeota archaeon]